MNLTSLLPIDRLSCDSTNDTLTEEREGRMRADGDCDDERGEGYRAKVHTDHGSVQLSHDR